MTDLSAIRTIDEVIEAARVAVDPGSRSWTAAGAGHGVTLARNHVALNSLALVSRLGRDVTSVDLSTKVTGVELSLPVFLAPVGALSLFDPYDGVAAAEGASRAGTIAMGATLSTSRWEDIAATSPGNHTFQLYVLGDREWQKDVVARIVAAGFAAICVTMDTPRIARRDAALEASYNWATPPQGTVNLTDGWDYTYRTAYTWDDLEWLCSTSPVPVVVKGVLHPGDARIAVDCGASGIYVSNHGGRVVDHEVSPIEMLGEIVGMVPSEVDVVVDSGFTRGAEVCKAVALGAKAVGIGRLQCWGLAIGGADGVAHVLEILRSEIAVTMANLGCSRLTDLTPAHVRWSMSAPPITG